MVDRRWSDEEMEALVEAWRSLYKSRRGGKSDAWVPPDQQRRVRSTRALVPEDWRAVATAVNSFRTRNDLDPIRTDRQCKRRVDQLKIQFGHTQLATPGWMGFVPPAVVRNNTAGRRGHSRLRVLAAAAMEAHSGDECGSGAAGGQARCGSVVAEGCSAAADNGGAVMGAGAATENANDGVAEEENGGAVMGVGAATENASDGVAEEVKEGGTTAPPPSGHMDRFTAGVTDFLGGPIPKKRRTGASTSTSAGAGDGRAASVKEELVREMNARRGRVDEGRAPAGGFAATATEMAAALAEVRAAESNDVAVFAKLSEMFKDATTLYRELTMERIELQRQMLAATAGGAAVPEPDAARA